jgi:hypothetical protein
MPTLVLGREQPFVYGSLSKEAIYLKPLPTSDAPKAPAPVQALANAPVVAPTQATTTAEDEQFWQAIKTSTVTGLYEEFLGRYPRSSRVAEARERLADLKSKQLASVVPSAAIPPTTTAVKSPSSRDAQDTQSVKLAEGEKLNLFTPEDARRVAEMGDELKLKMPQFAIGVARIDVPSSYRRFVGIWSSKAGWGHGKGRHAMLIVTDVASDGVVLGFYLWGPASNPLGKTAPQVS